MTTNSPQRYPAEVFWSDEDEGFIAIASDLPGCSAWGADEAQALTELRSAIEAWIEAAVAAGNPIPTPSRPADREQFSGKFLLRVPRRLHADLVRAAKSENVSLNQYLVYMLTEAMTFRVTASRMVPPIRFAPLFTVPNVTGQGSVQRDILCSRFIPQQIGLTGSEHHPNWIFTQEP